MASLDIEYTEENLTPSGNYDLLPAGWYKATITKSELKKTNSGGLMVAVRYDITAPTHEGRIIFGNFNIRNANSTAENIGRQQLNNLRLAIGLANPVQDTEELLGAEVYIKVGIGKPQYELNGKKEPILDSNGDKVIKYEAQNEVNGFKAIDCAELPEAKPKAEASVSEKKAAPWAKK
jgi:hypothetical protein